MPNRILKESITTSSTIDNLSWQAECFFYRLIVNCDDFGRMDGRTAVLLARCFPLRIGKVKEKDIQDWLRELISNDFIFMYKNGTEYLQVKSWDKHQQIRAKRSKFPEYDDTCHQLISDDCKCPRNPIQSESNPNTNPPKACDFFSNFWSNYPKKKAKGDAEKAWKKVKPEEYDALFKGLEAVKLSEDWLKDEGKYIPFPATWLNGRRWEDETGTLFTNANTITKAQADAMDRFEYLKFIQDGGEVVG